MAQRVVGVGTKLGDSTVYANRGDPDHVQAMAVLAYTNKGDGFVRKCMPATSPLAYSGLTRLRRRGIWR